VQGGEVDLSMRILFFVLASLFLCISVAYSSTLIRNAKLQEASIYKGGAAPEADSYLLLETGDYFLLETGDKIILE